ncbi:MAG TPA: patatin-like phospholipase family protein [Ktedonobacterales bacterium]
MKSGVSGGGRALVLGGGGVTGVAWETGVLFGLAEAGIDLTAADLFVGTSAGSVVAAQITSGMPLEKLFEAQVAQGSGEIAARMSLTAIAWFVIAGAWPGDRQKARARLGHAALRAKTVPEAERHRVIEGRVPFRDWPERRLLIPAVDAETGEAVIFDKDSGVALVDAVAASCAVPLVWPPVTIRGRRYVDGGVRSTANVDLAAGCERLVIVAPLTQAMRREDGPAAQAATLGEGVRSVIVSPDAAARAAIGGNVLDPAHRAPAAQAGRAQAASVAEHVREVWS